MADQIRIDSPQPGPPDANGDPTPVLVNTQTMVWGTILLDQAPHGPAQADPVPLPVPAQLLVRCTFTTPDFPQPIPVGDGLIYDPGHGLWRAALSLPVGEDGAPLAGEVRAVLSLSTAPGTARAVSSPLSVVVHDLDDDPVVSIGTIDLTAPPAVVLSGNCTAGFGVSCWFEPAGPTGPGPAGPVAINLVAAAVTDTDWSATLNPNPGGVYNFYAQLSTDHDQGFAFFKLPNEFTPFPTNTTPEATAPPVL
jgi:hypothetical protein